MATEIKSSVWEIRHRWRWIHHSRGTSNGLYFIYYYYFNMLIILVKKLVSHYVFCFFCSILAWKGPLSHFLKKQTLIMMVKSVSMSSVDFSELQVSNQEMLETLLVILFLGKSKRSLQSLWWGKKKTRIKKFFIPYVEKER